MNDSPLDKVPAHNRVSIRAVLVHEGEDASAALAEAGFADTISVPVVLGGQPDLSGGILGNGITPNVTAVLETEQEVEPGESPDAPADARQPEREDVGPSVPITTMLPPAFGMQPLAPVRSYSKAGRITKRAADAAPDLSAILDSADSSSLDTQRGSVRSETDDVHSPTPITSALTEPSSIQAVVLGRLPIAAGQNENGPSVPPRAPNPTFTAEAARVRNGAPLRVADLVTQTPDATAPVPFVDDRGQAILDDKGKPILRPRGMDAHFFVNQGVKDKGMEEAMVLSGGEGGSAAALGACPRNC